MPTISWGDTASGGDWDTAANWTGGALPQAADTAILQQPGLVTVVHGVGTDAIAALTAIDPLSVTGGILTVAGAATLAGGLSVGGGTLALGGASQISAGFNFTGGHIVVSGSTTVSGLATIGYGTIDGTGTLTTTGATTVNGQPLLNGGMTWVNTGTLANTGRLQLGSSTAAASLVNAAGGTINLGADITAGSTTSYTAAGQPIVTHYGTLSNAGLLQLTSLAGVTNRFTNAVFNESGTLSLGSNNLYVDAGGSIGGSVTGTGTLYLEGGTFTLNGPSVATAKLVLVGGIVDLAAGQTLSSLGVSYGTIDGAGTLVTSGATANTVSAVTLGGGLTWNNSGSVTSNRIILGDAAGAATFDNLAGGTLTLAGTVSSGGTSATLVNSGVITVGNGAANLFEFSGVSTISSTLLESGTISLASAPLYLSGGGTIGGSVIGTGTLQFTGGTMTVNAVSLASGIGVVVSGGTLAVAAPALTVSGGFDFASGSVKVAAGSVVSVASNATFAMLPAAASAHLSGPGTFVTYAHTTVGETDGYTTAALTLGGGISYVNAGTVTDTGFIRVGDSNGLTARLINATAGTFAFATDDAGIGNSAILSPLGTYGIGHARFFNFGQLVKSGGTGVTYDTADTYNAGTIEVASGTLDLTGAINDLSSTGGSATGTGVLKVDAGATLETNGIGTGQSVVFAGAGTLKLDAAAAPVAAIAGMASGVAFDLTGVAGATASINGKTLSITPTNGKAMTFLSNAAITGLNAMVAGDGHGGTLVTLVAAAGLNSLARDLTFGHATVTPPTMPARIGMVMPTPTISPVLFVHH